MERLKSRYACGMCVRLEHVCFIMLALHHTRSSVQVRRTFAISLLIPARVQPQKQLSHCRMKCVRVNQKMRSELQRLILPHCASFGTCVVYVALLHHRSSKHVGTVVLPGSTRLDVPRGTAVGLCTLLVPSSIERAPNWYCLLYTSDAADE